MKFAPSVAANGRRRKMLFCQIWCLRPRKDVAEKITIFNRTKIKHSSCLAPKVDSACKLFCIAECQKLCWLGLFWAIPAYLPASLIWYLDCANIVITREPGGRQKNPIKQMMPRKRDEERYYFSLLFFGAPGDFTSSDVGTGQFAWLGIGAGTVCHIAGQLQSLLVKNWRI